MLFATETAKQILSVEQSTNELKKLWELILSNQNKFNLYYKVFYVSVGLFVLVHL